MKQVKETVKFLSKRSNILVPSFDRLTGIGIDVGLRYYADNKSLLWDDGSLAASDLPWRDGPPRKFKKDKFCRIYHEGPLLYHNGRNHKRSLCGNCEEFSVFFLSLSFIINHE